jgi:hypothetical protein
LQGERSRLEKEVEDIIDHQDSEEGQAQVRGIDRRRDRCDVISEELQRRDPPAPATAGQ